MDGLEALIATGGLKDNVDAVRSGRKAGLGRCQQVV